MEIPVVTSSFRVENKYFEDVKKIIRKYSSIRFRQEPYVLGNEIWISIDVYKSGEYGEFSSELNELLYPSAIDNSKENMYNRIKKKIKSYFNK